MNLTTLLLFLAGLALLIIGAELLVRGAKSLALALGVSALIVGETVVALGTSAPEMAVTIQSTFAGQGTLAMGAIVGSNLANILLVLGLASLICPLRVSPKLLKYSVPMMIAASVITAVMAQDGLIDRVDGLLLIAGAVVYGAFAYLRDRKPDPLTVANANPEPEGDTRVEAPSNSPPQRPRGWIQTLKLVLGLVGLLAGARMMVDSASTVATSFGVSEVVIGLTIVAIGTSLPEIVTSIVAGSMGQSDIALGNAIGSNISNLFLVLGVCAVVSPAGVEVDPMTRQIDLPVMLAVAVACLPLFLTGYVISRLEGLALLAYYAAYSVQLYLRVDDGVYSETVGTIMFGYITPCIAILLILLGLLAMRQHRLPGPPA